MPDVLTHASAFDFTIDLRRPGFVGGSPGVIEALVRLRAPAKPDTAATREPVTLAIVLDRSASMAGASLDAAKECARSIVRDLGPKDRAAIVASAEEAQVLCPVVGAEERFRLIKAVDAIEEGGASDLHAGWLAGARLLGESITGFGVYRVVVLSDGRMTRGETDVDAIAQSCRDLARQGISTSTYGIGDAFNAALMLAMAKGGQGSARYGETAQDLIALFRAELARLTSLCARGMVLKVHAAKGVQVTLRNDYPPAEGEGYAWRLPDLAWGAEASAYLKFTVPSVFLADPVVDLPITVSIKAASAGRTPLFFMGSLPGVQRMSRAALMTLAPHPLVERRREEIAAAEALDLVRRLVARGHGDAARVQAERAQRRFASNGRCTGMLEAMHRMVARRASSAGKITPWAGAKSPRRVPTAQETTRADEDLAIPAFLLRKPVVRKMHSLD